MKRRERAGDSQIAITVPVLPMRSAVLNIHFDDTRSNVIRRMKRCAHERRTANRQIPQRLGRCTFLWRPLLNARDTRTTSMRSDVIHDAAHPMASFQACTALNSTQLVAVFTSLKSAYGRMWLRHRLAAEMPIERNRATERCRLTHLSG